MNIQLPFIKKKFKNSPVREYRNITINSNDPGYVNRLMIATPTTGNIRYEWAAARFGQMVPTNWSSVFMAQFIPNYGVINYQVADAQNLIVQTAVEKDFEWLLLIEHDVVLPPDCFVKLNQYIIAESFPVVSGLYFTRSIPSEPMIYRGRGVGPYYEWNPGEVVYCDGVPTGILLIHMGLIREMYKDAPEYQISYGSHQTTKEVFNTPQKMLLDPETGQCNTTVGTSDLEWCTKVIEKDYMRKAGWIEYLDNLPDKRYPFMVDTSIFCWHINQDGTKFPIQLPGEKKNV